MGREGGEGGKGGMSKIRCTCVCGVIRAWPVTVCGLVGGQGRQTPGRPARQ